MARPKSSPKGIGGSLLAETKCPHWVANGYSISGSERRLSGCLPSLSGTLVTPAIGQQEPLRKLKTCIAERPVSPIEGDLQFRESQDRSSA